jgi:RNA polymerase sigma factor (sigma-70 family)
VTVQRPVEGRPSEDAGLVRRARDGDTSAFDELVIRHRDVAFRVAWLVTRNSHEAEDATQEAFVKAYYALPRFRSESPFRPWILRIVANEAKNRGRSSRRREALAVRAAARVASASPRRADRPRFFASFATIRRTQGLKGDPGRNLGSA